MTIWQPPVIRKKFSIPQLVVSGCWRLMALTRKWWNPSHTDLQTSQKPTCNHMSRCQTLPRKIYIPQLVGKCLLVIDWSLSYCWVSVLSYRPVCKHCLCTLVIIMKLWKMQQKWKIQKARIWIMKHVGCRIESRILRWRWRFFISGLHYTFSSCITTWLVINKYL